MSTIPLRDVTFYKYNDIPFKKKIKMINYNNIHVIVVSVV